jgi:hypothetical protein
LPDAAAGQYDLTATVTGLDGSGAGVTRSDLLVAWVSPVASDVSAVGYGRTGGESVPARPTRLSVTPNPFNASTDIRFELWRPQRVELVVYDVTGRKVVTLADRLFAAGPQSVTWRGRDERGRGMSSGVYLVRMRSEGRVWKVKMVLVK